MDMVGRIDDKYTDGNYIYVIGSDRLSSQLHELNLNINRKYSKLTLDFTYNDANDPNRFYFRSDHYNFAEKGIPSIFFFNGTHEDYHRITDDREKILFGKMEKIGKHIFYLAWAIANQDERLPVDRN
jgi:Zn-dependent M28 family amino/carboxypeptidase